MASRLEELKARNDVLTEQLHKSELAHEQLLKQLEVMGNAARQRDLLRQQVAAQDATIATLRARIDKLEGRTPATATASAPAAGKTP